MLAPSVGHSRREVGPLVRHDAPGGSDSFETRRGVDDVADDALPIWIVAIELDDRLPGRDRDANRQSEIGIVLVEPFDGILDA